MSFNLKKEFEERIYMYPFDALYIKKIASKIGLAMGEEYKLFSLMGGQELADTLPLVKHTNFHSEAGNEFRFNLHLHTNYSNTPQTTNEILKKATEIANKNALISSDLPAFTIALSDFNNIEATKEALYLLTKRPNHYKNLRIVLASEFTSSWKSEKIQKKPIDFELIYYGLNPFDEELNNYLEKSASTSKSLTDLFCLQRQSEFGFLGLSHPQKINISDFLAEDFIKDCEKKCVNASYYAMNYFLTMLKDRGLRAIEINYQFKFPHFEQAQRMLSGQSSIDTNDSTYCWLKFFNDFAEHYGMLKTGGYDVI